MLDRRLGSGRLSVIVLFALVNLPALVLVCWLTVHLHAQRTMGVTIEFSSSTTLAILGILLGGMGANLILYRGVIGMNSRLIDAIEQCTEQQRRAETAQLARDRFLLSINHEIRTPLNGILGMAEILLSHGELSDKQAEQLALLKLSAERLSRLLEQLLRRCEESPPLVHATLLLSSNESHRRKFDEMLTAAGYNVVAVADAQSGMTELVRGVVEGSPFTLIIVADESLDGTTNTWLRQVESSPARCPAIVLSPRSGLLELREALSQA